MALDLRDFIHPNDLPRSLSCRRAFSAEAVYQRVCAKCGSSGGFHAHHVIEEQVLERMGLPRWDYRCALRVCWDCHINKHHSASDRITTQELGDLNIVFVVCVLGERSRDFIVANYWHFSEEGEDPRVAEALALRPADMPSHSIWDMGRRCA